MICFAILFTADRLKLAVLSKFQLVLESRPLAVHVNNGSNVAVWSLWRSNMLRVRSWLQNRLKCEVFEEMLL